MDYPVLLERLLAKETLATGEAQAVMQEVLAGDVAPERLAGLLVALRTRSPDGDELAGFARAMRSAARHIDAGSGPVLDTCGTGGAPCKSFNVSTPAAFVLAGAGIKVAKHGNRSVTRPSGSADVLESLGARLELEPKRVEAVLRDVGIAFLFAPAFHPAMRHAAPVRQALGIKTVFNLLGPLTNPAGATHQVLGVYDEPLVAPMAKALGALGVEGVVVHGQPGFDEATPAGPIIIARTGTQEMTKVHPEDLGVAPCTVADLMPVTDAAATMRTLLAGNESGPRADTVALNVALGLHAVGHVPDLATGVQTARELLASGIGNAKLDAYLGATQG